MSASGSEMNAAVEELARSDRAGAPSLAQMMLSASHRASQIAPRAADSPTRANWRAARLKHSPRRSRKRRESSGYVHWPHLLSEENLLDMSIGPTSCLRRSFSING